MTKSWTPHDFNAGGDKLILKLRTIHKLEGYAFFWLAIEALGRESDHRLSLPDAHEVLSHDSELTDKKTEKILQTCIDIGLLESDGVDCWSVRLCSEMEKYETVSAKRADAGRKGGQQKASNSLAIAKQEPGNSLAMTGHDTTGQDNTEQQGEGGPPDSVTDNGWGFSPEALRTWAAVPAASVAQ